MASTTRNSVSRHVREQFGNQEMVEKTSLQQNSVVTAENNNIAVDQLFSVAQATNTTYTLNGTTFLTVQLNDPSTNKNSVFKFINGSGYAHEITGALPNIIADQGSNYSKAELDVKKGSYITLMSDGNNYNVLDTSGKINYE